MKTDFDVKIWKSNGGSLADSDQLTQEETKIEAKKFVYSGK